MDVFNHLLYEYLKGIRPLSFHTCKLEELGVLEELLRSKEICYRKYHINSNKYNLLFGDLECIAVLDLMPMKTLAHLSPEEDFILGIMLGYDRTKQCVRYKRLKTKKNCYIKAV